MTQPILPVKIYKDEEGDRWVTVVCPYCGTDLSRASVGRLVHHPGTDLASPEIYFPLRCLECNHPLLPPSILG